MLLAISSMMILSASQHAGLIHASAALLLGTFRMLRRSSQDNSVQGFVEHLHRCPPLISVHWCMSVPKALAARQILKEVDAMGRDSKHSALLIGKALLRKAD